MQYPIMNMHRPEFDCYSNSNKNCIESIFNGNDKKPASMEYDPIEYLWNSYLVSYFHQYFCIHIELI